MNREREAFGIVFAAAILCFGPILTADFYPITRMPMFSDAPGTFVVVRVFDAAGNELDPKPLKLHSNYLANSSAVLRHPQPASIHQRDQFIDPKLIEKTLSAIKDRPKKLMVTQELYGKGSDGFSILEKKVLNLVLP